jgi:hypothetical protein
VVAISGGHGHGLAIVSNSPPVILEQPANKITYTGASTSLSVKAYGSLPMTYQWQFNGVNLRGATKATLTFAQLKLENAGRYRAILSNQFGTTPSQEVLLTVMDSAPFIIAPPTNRVGYLGKSVSLQVLADGSQPLRYQWRFEGTNIPGATNPVLTLSPMTTNLLGSYSVTISNAFGAVLSPEATLAQGPVFAWGSNASGQTDVPPDLSEVVAIAAGSAHSLALKSDGTVVGWGSNGFTESTIRPWMTNVAAILAGDQFSVILYSNGIVRAWGNTAEAPPDATNVQAIANGLFLKTDGTVLDPSFPPPAEATNIIAVAGGQNRRLALRADGRILAWGDDWMGGPMTPPDSAIGFVAIAAGAHFGLGLQADGTILAWGPNWFGEALVPREATNIVSISANNSRAMALRSDGRVLVWGDFDSGQSPVPTELTFARAIAAGYYHDLALLGSGDLCIFRQPSSQRVAAGTRTLLWAPALGRGTIKYQWMRNGTNVPGATQAYYVNFDSQDWDAGSYQAVISNGEGSLTSAVATVTITPSAPVITVQPLDQQIPPHQTITIVCVAAGTWPNYQWKYNGVDLPGATNSALTLADVQAANSGDYQVTVSNALGAVTSRLARLEVYPYTLAMVLTNTQGACSTAWGDYDNDGWLDLLVGGKGGGQPAAVNPRLFHNNGDATFTEIIVGFDQPVQSFAWGDFDNDGYLDIVLTSSPSRIWHNNGNGSFNKLNFTLVADNNATVALADFNRDGLLDILLGGRLYQNLGNNQFTNIAAGLPTTQNSTAAWGDYDGDGLPDLFICGRLGPAGRASSQLYRNLGNGTFTNINAGFINIYRGAGVWLDYDRDGRPDLMLTGENYDGYPSDTLIGMRYSMLYHNEGDERFTIVPSGLRPSTYASLSVGDYDNDGRSDVFLTGYDATNKFSGSLYRVQTNGACEVVTSPFPVNIASAAAWGDYDRDGRLDLALCLTAGDMAGVNLYHNGAARTNTLPLPPAFVSVEKISDEVTLRWSVGQDAETPAAGLSYNLRVGRGPGAGDLIAPDADSQGWRQVAQPGNAGNATSYKLSHLPFGRYYWAVQTVDSAYAGSAFTPEQVLIHAILTLPATGIARRGAVLNGLWNTNLLPGDAWFEWGTTTNYGYRTPPASFTTNTTGTLVGAEAIDLIPYTTYYFRLVVTNAEGLQWGGEQVFTTTDVPQIVELLPMDLTSSHATLNAQVNPNREPTWVWFEYGLTDTYTASTPALNLGAGRDLLAVTQSVSGLIGGQVYHYRVVATNQAGQAATADLTLATTTEPEVVTLPANPVAITAATLNGLVRPNTLPTTAFFEYGPTTNLGSATQSQDIGSGTNRIAVRAPVDNLSRLSTYFFQVVASNVAGLSRGSLIQFSTFEEVNAIPASNVQISSAVLNGLVYPQGLPTTVAFEYGPAMNFSYTTPALLLEGGTNLASFSYPITGLLPNTAYNFRVVATNANGLRTSTPLSFQTLPWFSLLDAGQLGLTLTNQGPLGFRGATAWGDYDNDGNLDLLVTSQTGTLIYRNLGQGNFVVVNTGIPGNTPGWITWGDYNNDGWLDILIVGSTVGSKIFRNNGDGTFTDIQAGLGPVGSGMALWGDFNNDGRQDVLLVDKYFGTKLYQNQGKGSFTNLNVPLPIFFIASGAVVDYDNDGRLDFLLMGRVDPGAQILTTTLFRNLGDGTFQDSGIVLPGVDLASADWGDFDGDGLPDLLLNGRNRYGFYNLMLYRNTGNGTFADLSSLLPSAAPDAAFWGDFNNDGRLDILLRGQKYNFSASRSNSLSGVLRNDGTNGFSLANFPLPEISYSAGGLADFNRDGRLEVVIAGNSPTGVLFCAYQNLSEATNTPPSPPLQLSNVVAGNAVTLSWACGADRETPAASLTYNIRVARFPGGIDVISPLADASGLRRVVAAGNTGQARTFTLTNLAPGQYYWSVQAIDSAFAGSAFAPELEFAIPSVLLAFTGDATNVRPFSAMLSGAVLANAAPAAAYFEWGNTTDLGATTPAIAFPPDLVTHNISTNLTNLVSGTAYFYRAVATNALGIAFGQVRQFESVACPMLSANLTAERGVSLLFDGASGVSYHILVSTNLVDWADLGAATSAGSNQFHYLDSTATNYSTRFYRIVTDELVPK